MEELGANIDDIIFDDLKTDTIVKSKLIGKGDFDNFFSKRSRKPNELYDHVSEISSDDFNVEF